MSDPAPSLYPILNVDPDTVEDEEQLGSKPKFWFRHEGRRWLFKEVRPGTGEHWAEKVAAELAVLLEVPAAKVELAECLGKRGSASQSFIQARRKDEERERRLKEHTVVKYVQKGRGGIFNKVGDKHGLSPLEAALLARQRYPKLFERWWQRLEALEELRMRQIEEQVPHEWMSPAAREFALAFLCASRRELLASITTS